MGSCIDVDDIRIHLKLILNRAARIAAERLTQLSS